MPPRPTTASRTPPARWKLRRGLCLTFPEAQWAVTPGQSAVLYDGDVCLGGGVIAAVTARHRLRPGGAFVMPSILLSKDSCWSFHQALEAIFFKIGPFTLGVR